MDGAGTIDGEASAPAAELIRPRAFTLRFGLALALTLIAYWPLRELHHRAAVTIAAAWHATVGDPLGVIVLDPGGRMVEALSRPRQVSVSIARSTLDLLLGGFVLLPALLAADPRTRRWRPGSVAVAGLLLAQFAHLTLLIDAHHLELTGASDAWTATLRETSGTVALGFPFLVWMAAGGGALLLPRAAAPLGDAVSRNAPCPCGSGVKWKRCCGTSAS